MRTKVSKQPRFKDTAGDTSIFSYESDEYEISNGVADKWEEGKLYRRAERLEQRRVFDLNALNPEEKLKHLKEEVLVRVKITQKEIFQIGELLCMAKKVCQEQKISYQKWVESNFKFSYETSNNFVNVFKQCFAHVHLAIQLPISILYKISSPSFPDDLREYLLHNGKYIEITNGKLRKLVEKYKEGGMEAVANDIEHLRTGCLIQRQIRYNLDQFENALRILDGLFDKMERGERGGIPFDMENQVVDQVPEAKLINLKLYDSLEEAIKILSRSKGEAGKILGNYMDRLQTEHLLQEWKEDYEPKEG